MTTNTTNPEDVDIEDVDYAKLPASGFFPESWSDNARCDVLFAPFRAKAINPVNYETKMLFWKNLILKYCEIKGSSSVSERELSCAFQRNKKKPHCLNTVLAVMKQDNQIQLMHEFMVVPARTWKDWAVLQVKRPVHWGWNKIGERVWRASESKYTEYIVVEAAKRHSEKLLKSLPTNKVISMDEFTKTIAEHEPELVTSQGVEYALHYLKLQKQADQETIDLSFHSQSVLKFSPVGGRCSITETDMEVYAVKWQENDLIKTCEDLEQQISQHDDIVRNYIRENKKQLAKNYLKKKHILSKQLGEFVECVLNTLHLSISLLTIRVCFYFQTIKQTN